MAGVDEERPDSQGKEKDTDEGEIRIGREQKRLSTAVPQRRICFPDTRNFKVFDYDFGLCLFRFLRVRILHVGTHAFLNFSHGLVTLYEALSVCPSFGASVCQSMVIELKKRISALPTRSGVVLAVYPTL